MATISISKNHSLSPDSLRQQLSLLQDKLQNKYRTESTWENSSTMSVKGPGIKGALNLLEDRIAVDLDLGLMLRPMKGKIEETLHRELEKLISKASSTAG